MLYHGGASQILNDRHTDQNLANAFCTMLLAQTVAAAVAAV